MATKPDQQTDYAHCIQKLEEAVRQQMAAYGIGGVAVALVDDQRLVYSAGFGTAKRDSIFRAGSISKVFNGVAIMQLVEQGKLDLDVPIRQYGPEFSLLAPFDGAPPVTLRLLLCHRSGLCRESPVGGYLDGSQPSLADTALSIRDCPLLAPPNSDTRYSNIGPSVAGQILAKIAGVPYHEYQRQHVLGPLGMASSAFLLKDIDRGRLAPAGIRVADGRGGFYHAEAPLFDLGTIPAGNLYTTAEDLAKFVSMLAAGGRAGGKQIVSEETLDNMTTLQVTGPEGLFGIAFRVGMFDSQKWIGHNGAVYGYTCALFYLPSPKLGVVVLTSEDIVTGPMDKLAKLALGAMLQAKTGEILFPQPGFTQVAPQDLLSLAGDYESPSHWAKIEVADGKLVANIGGQSIRMTPVGKSSFLGDSRVMNSSPFEFERDAAGKGIAFTAMLQKFTRVDPVAEPEVPPLWSQYVGAYGPSFIPLVVSVRHGHLYATSENELDYRLTPASRQVFNYAPGMYRLEQLVFLTNGEGKVHGVNFANMYLKKTEQR